MAGKTKSNNRYLYLKKNQLAQNIPSTNSLRRSSIYTLVAPQFKAFAFTASKSSSPWPTLKITYELGGASKKNNYIRTKADHIKPFFDQPNQNYGCIQASTISQYNFFF
jgi:hypothetical protein